MTFTNMLRTNKTHKFSTISLFTGAGGLDIGFEQAGFDTLSAVEVCTPFCDTLLLNQAKQIPIPGTDRYYLQGTKVLNCDIRSISACDLNPNGIDIDCLIGGPPCQTFSSAGKQDSIFDQRGTLIYEYLRLLKELKPRTFLFENVRGLVTARGRNNEPGEVLLDLIGRMEQEGYHCRASLLNSADFGSYQRRVRCFIIGSRTGAPPEFPAPTHGENVSAPSLFHKNIAKWNTLGDFLSKHADLDKDNWTRPTPSLSEELSSLPEGKGVRSKGRIEATRPSGHWGYRQGTFIADTKKPARTVTGSSSQDWIRLDDGSLRRITLREAAALQGFPDEWEFCGNKSQMFQQIGNAVPAIFGKAIGTSISNYITEGSIPDNATATDSFISKKIMKSIRYTKYDNEKNGAFRVNRLAGLRK